MDKNDKNALLLLFVATIEWTPVLLTVLDASAFLKDMEQDSTKINAQ